MKLRGDFLLLIPLSVTDRLRVYLAEVSLSSLAYFEFRDADKLQLSSTVNARDVLPTHNCNDIYLH